MIRETESFVNSEALARNHRGGWTLKEQLATRSFLGLDGDLLAHRGKNDNI